MNLSCALKGPRERPDSALSNWHVCSTVELQQAQCVLCAVTNIRVATNARYRKEVQLWSHDGAGNCQRVI
jgi:hypothetical protein